MTKKPDHKHNRRGGRASRPGPKPAKGSQQQKEPASQGRSTASLPAPAEQPSRAFAGNGLAGPQCAGVPLRNTQEETGTDPGELEGRRQSPLPACRATRWRMSGVKELLAEIDHMDLEQLRAAWKGRTGSAAPGTMSKELLRLATGYHVQEREFGGLNRRTFLRLQALGSGKTARADQHTSPRLKPGTRLLREWNGKVHEVMALDDGRYAYGGQVWGSLSEIATGITGVRWSGPRFFATKERGRRNAHG